MEFQNETHCTFNLATYSNVAVLSLTNLWMWKRQLLKFQAATKWHFIDTANHEYICMFYVLFLQRQFRLQTWVFCNDLSFSDGILSSKRGCFEATHQCFSSGFLGWKHGDFVAICLHFSGGISGSKCGSFIATCLWFFQWIFRLQTWVFCGDFSVFFQLHF